MNTTATAPPSVRQRSAPVASRASFQEFLPQNPARAVYKDVMWLKSRTEQSDDLLVRDVLDGNGVAYAELVRRHERLVHAAAWAILRDHHAAQDVTQETFVKAYRGLAGIRLRNAFGPWLLTIARRTATDVARARRRTVSIPDLPHNAPADAIDEDGSALLLAALARLPDHEQQVVLLRYFEDLPVADIAARLGGTVNTITKRLSRGLGRLRAQLKEMP
jgi:RNA polymerase sigma factor (sigma-70 family)